MSFYRTNTVQYSNQQASPVLASQQPLFGGYMDPRFPQQQPSPQMQPMQPTYVPSPNAAAVPIGLHQVQALPIGAMGGVVFGEAQPPPVTTVCLGFEGSDVYIANQGVIVGRKEKRYIRIRWGDGQKGHKARWVGFAPSDWKMNRPLATDPQLLGFYVKPNLCDRSNKSKRNSGWVTLSIDCAHRAIKATIDGWTLGKVFIPTWLIGRVMRPVAVAETGMPVKFDMHTEEGCEKVLRAGFLKWSTITNTPLTTLRCHHTGRNFESDVLGMSLDVSFDDESNVAGINDCESGYISYNAVDMGLANVAKEVIPLVINDRHAFRCKERGLWDLFYADGRVPLDYLSERMTALIRKIYEAKHQNRKRLYAATLTKLAHFRHILFFLAKNQEVVEDANSRVQWFLSNTSQSGAHKEFTPDLGRLLTCVAVSDYEWEDVAVPFFAEALQRAIPEAMKQNPRISWSGKDCNLEDMFDALMTADHALSETLLHVMILTRILKPHHSQLDEVVLERLSAEELCCGIAGLSSELQILEYERSARKDEIKKCLIKREWQHEFSEDQWKLIEGVLDNPIRLRGMLARSRMIAECHGTCGLATEAMFRVIDDAHELAKTVEDFREYLGCYNIAFPGEKQMFSICKKAVVMATRKGYINESTSPAAALPDEEAEGLLSARQALSLTPSGSEILSRQGRPEPTFHQEVLPNICQSSSSPSDGMMEIAQVADLRSTAEGEKEPTSPVPPHQLPEVGETAEFPAIVNRTSDPVYTPQHFLMPGTASGTVSGQTAGQPIQYVQVMPSTANAMPTPRQPAQRVQLLASPATTPGSVHILQTPDGLVRSFSGPGQLVMNTTPRFPNHHRPPNRTEGEMSGWTHMPQQQQMGYVSPSPMGHQLPVHSTSPTFAQVQHEGQTFVLAYATPPQGVQMIKV